MNTFTEQIFMNSYIILYSISIAICNFIGWQVMKKYHNPAGFFFFLFTIFISIWYFLYFLYFTGIEDPKLLLYISRGAFVSGVISLYSLVFCVGYLDLERKKLFSKGTIAVCIIYLFVLYVYLFTGGIIKGIEYSRDEHVYREVYGNLYSIGFALYPLFIVSFSIIAFRKLKKLEGLERIRIRRIIFALCVFLFSLIFLQAILPIFGIWILEKEIIFLFLFFIIYTSITLKKYYFTSSTYNTGKIFIGILSGIIAICVMNLLKYYFITLHDGKVANYWGWNDEFSVIDSIITLLVYLAFYKVVGVRMLGNDSVVELKNHVRQIEKEISKFTDMESVGKVLNKGLHHSFHTGRAYIQLFNPEETGNNELQRFFLKESKHELFISDFAFIDDHKKDYDMTKIEKQIPKDMILVIPLYSTSNINIGGLFIGKKPFGDFYTEDEIKTLKEFAFFLETHLKYIRVYNMLRDMTENLDKKVDEKTLEYNDLINRQKDFIRMISHEIRSPIGSAIFQSDSIIDDIESGEYDKEHIKEELNILSEQLVKTGEILTKLFSVEYYDVHSVSLFRENIDIYSLFDEEIKIAMKANPKIHFINGMDKSIGFGSIDKIQFRQVITNLISNAIKFATNEKPTIIIEGYKKDGSIQIGIEDNGPGFDGIDTSSVFDKYTIGKGNRVGLGMGLYLCKRIVEMHSGEIRAKPGSHLGGARFDIIIPIL